MKSGGRVRFDFALGAVLVLAAAVVGASCTPSPSPSSAPPSSEVSPVPSAANASSSDTTTVRVAVQGRPDQAPVELAYRRGYFDQLGIHVEEVQVDSGSQMVPLLSTNNLQVGNGSPSASLFNAFDRGVSIPIVADWAHTGGPEDTTSSLVIRRDLYDAGVRSMAAGWRVGTPGVGTSADITLQAALDKDGIDRTSITTVNLATADVIAALANKNLEAGIITEPLVTDTVQKGIASVLYTAGALRPGTYLSVMQYSPQFASDQPDVATRFMEGYLKGVRDYYDAFHLKQGESRAIDILTKYLTVTDRNVWETSGPEYIDLNGYVDASQLQQQADFFANEGLLEGPVPNMAQYVDLRFANAAVDVLGRR